MLKKSLALVFLTAPCALLLAYPVHAQQLSPRGPIPFEMYDQDNNGFIIVDEFNTVRGQRISANAAQGRQMRGMPYAPSFSDLDLNKDGKLTRNELAKGQQLQMQKRREMQYAQAAGMPGRGMGRNMPVFAEFDLNADGSLSEEEFIQARNRRIEARAKQGYPMRNLANMPAFQSIDADADGNVTREEFSAHQQQHFQQMQQRRAAQWRQMQQSRNASNNLGLPGRGMGRNMPVFDEFDLNADGSLSEEEFIQARNRRIKARAKQGYPMRNLANMPAFQSIDADADGNVTREEFSAHQQQHLQQMQQRRAAQWRQMQQSRNASNNLGLPGRGMGRNMPVFAEFDLNADGSLSEEEFIQARNRRIEARAKQGYPMRNLANMPAFQSIDADADGNVTREEFSAHQQQHLQQMQQRRAAQWRQMQQSRNASNNLGLPGRGMGRNMPVFAEFDLNADGSLSEEEFIQARNRRIEARAKQGYPMRNLANMPAFQSIDADADGKISPQEFSTHQLEHRKQRK